MRPRIIASATSILILAGAGAALAQTAQPKRDAPAAAYPPTASVPATTAAPVKEGSTQAHVVETPSAPTRTSPTGGNSGGGQ